MSAAIAGKVNANLASGAYPSATFPNMHLLAPAMARRNSAVVQDPQAPTRRRRPSATFPNLHLLAEPAAMAEPESSLAGVAKWSPSRAGAQLDQLRQAVEDEDWARNFQEGLTTIDMRPDWSASADRCSFLQLVASSNGAKRVLEVGSFCGVASLALAETLPDDGKVHTLEIDRFVVDFGQRFISKTQCGRKITTEVGPAKEALDRMAAAAAAGELEPFDFVIIDADKAGMRAYFDLIWETPGLLSDRGVVCVDLTPFKGQPPLRYVKYGFPNPWEGTSGQKEIDALRAHVAASPKFVSHEVGKLLVVQKLSQGQ